MSFYNTTRLAGSELSASRANAKGQEELILEFFRSRPSQMFSPEEVHRHLFSDATPLTSTRRTITDLTSDLYLEKTDMMVMGKYGKPVHTWKLRVPNNNQLTLI